MALFLPQKGTKAQIDALPIVDGQLLWTTDQTENEIYYDDGLSRVTLKGGYSSYTPTASNLGTIARILALRNGGVAEFKLNAISGNWTSGTDYIICTLSEPYRPDAYVSKEIALRNGVIAYFSIDADGDVHILPRTSINSLSIAIDETFII